MGVAVVRAVGGAEGKSKTKEYHAEVGQKVNVRCQTKKATPGFGLPTCTDLSYCIVW